jgi:hypothetical protein
MESLTFNGESANWLFKGIPELKLPFEKYRLYCFNPSHIVLSNGLYLVACRIFFTHKDVVPGNDARCGKDTPTPGKNFWWNNWSSQGKFFGTVFYVCNGTFTECVSVHIRFHDSMEDTHWGLGREDVRLFNMYGKLYLHTRDLTEIYKIKLTYNTTTKVCMIVLKEMKQMGISELGHNQQLVRLNLQTKEYVCVDRFGDVGVEFHKYQNNKKINTFYIHYDKGYGLSVHGSEENDGSYGVNSGIMPCLSFTTPHVVIGRWLVGVGHIKISNDPSAYIPDSNIATFRNTLHKEMKEKYGDKYIIHQGRGRIVCAKCGGINKKCKCPEPKEWVAKDIEGYIYMMFYYIISKEFTSMYMSDAFLPIDERDEYQFSLVFPMGLSIRSDNRVTVSYGKGDYYAKIMTGPSIFDIISSCKHNVKRMDFHDYKYETAQV